MVNGLVKRGHEVTLFAHEESRVPCRLISYGSKKTNSISDSLRIVSQITAGYFRNSFDIIHNFGRLAYLFPILPLKIPILMTYQREISPRSISMANFLSLGKIHFTGCSQNLIRNYKDKNNFHVVYNGVSLSDYDFVEQVDDDAALIFLGRIEEIKGTHKAIEVAQKTKKRLVIAGNIPNTDIHKNYFETKIKPHIDDSQIRYIGPVNDIQKNKLLGSAKALLMPVLWEEPFGIVMAEALACGTPVIGFNRGSVPEVVEHGINGFVASSTQEMISCISKISKIKRSDCRSVCEKKFSENYILDSYLRIYKNLLGEYA